MIVGMVFCSVLFGVVFGIITYASGSTLLMAFAAYAISGAILLLGMTLLQTIRVMEADALHEPQPDRSS